MAWFWTDDLARTLIEDGVVSSGAVQDWITRPIGIAVAEGADPAEVGRLLLGDRPGLGVA